MSPVRPIAIFGAGFHGRTVLAAFRDQEVAHEIVFFDDSMALLTIDGICVLGNRHSMLQGGWVRTHDIIVGVGNVEVRGQISRSVLAAGGRLVSCIHPSAVIGHDVEIGPGTFIGPQAVVGVGCRIGSYCLVNQCASLGHGSRLEDGCSVNDGCRLSDSPVIGEEAYLGMGVIVLAHVRIGARSIIGAGAVVTKDIPPDRTALGVPARVIKDKGSHG